MRMIPRLEAEESIRRSNEIAVGTGAIRNPRELADEWRRQANDEGPPAPATRKAVLFSDEVLGRLPVRRVFTRKG